MTQFEIDMTHYLLVVLVYLIIYWGVIGIFDALKRKLKKGSK